MKLCIRAHDLGVRGTEDILGQLERLGLDGVQMVCYKVYDGILKSYGDERGIQSYGTVVDLLVVYYK